MVLVTIEGDAIVMTVADADGAPTPRRRLEIPRAHVTSARVDATLAMKWFRGFRIAGADVPQMLRPGLFYRDGATAFWDVRDPENTIVLTLEHEEFSTLVVEVANPARTVAALESS